MTLANLPIGDFELAVERSFLYFLRNTIPSITSDSVTVPVQFNASMPYDQFEDARLGGCVCMVSLTQIRQEGWHIGTEIDQVKSTTNTMQDIYIPFRYLIQFSINAFSGSSIDRAKLDGAIMAALEGARTTGIPVYSFSTEVAAVTANDTGSRITFPSVALFSRTRSDDPAHHDYLTNWTLDGKCLYVFETITRTVTTVSVSSNIVNPQTGELIPSPTPTILPPVIMSPLDVGCNPDGAVNYPIIGYGGWVTDPQGLPLTLVSFDATSVLGGTIVTVDPTTVLYTPPTGAVLVTDSFNFVVTNGTAPSSGTMTIHIADF